MYVCMYVCMYHEPGSYTILVIEGSLEVKLPTI